MSIKEKIEILELIARSLKQDIKHNNRNKRLKFKRFKVRKFYLGQEVHVDRDDLYSERGS